MGGSMHGLLAVAWPGFTQVLSLSCCADELCLNRLAAKARQPQPKGLS
jgi:hypothetical protein